MKPLAAAALVMAAASLASGEARAASDWPIVAPGTSLTRTGNRSIPASLRAALITQPVICDDGWGDDGAVNSPVTRFFATADGRTFAAVQCPGADADVTAVFENTDQAIFAHSFAVQRQGRWLGTTLLDVLNLEPMTGVIISQPPPDSCGLGLDGDRFTYKLGPDGFVLLKAETLDCASKSWAVTYGAS